eukprot:scaffold30641_cov103-Cyclotella_meneghiniana.AAC.3
MVSIETCDNGVPGRKRGRVNCLLLGSYRNPTPVIDASVKLSESNAKHATSASVRIGGGTEEAMEDRPINDAVDK